MLSHNREKAWGMKALGFLIFFLSSSKALASAPLGQDLTASGVGYFCLAIFGLALLLVIFEEKLHLPKSKPMIMASGVIWIAIAATYASSGVNPLLEQAARHNLLEYAELFLFLMVAMTYISALTERGVFDALRAWLVGRGFGYRSIFWVTGVMAFCLSPFADNLTTALLMGAVVVAVGESKPEFVGMACINLVVAANAGGAFSPFGDITTLMVWQKGLVDFWTFFHLFLPSLVCFLVPALVMSFFLPKEKPMVTASAVLMREGAIRVIFLFLLTVATAVIFHVYLHLPPVFGMMTGLAYLQFFAFYLKRKAAKTWEPRSEKGGILGNPLLRRRRRDLRPFDIFDQIAQSEWDTLLFFYGVVMCVGGLGFLGYLHLLSTVAYGQLGPTPANVMIGVLSAIVDNIPVMFAVLSMMPQMDLGQWLLVTLTAGVGGSLLSVGSAAGVALMGQSQGHYTFFGHLKWSPVILLGFGLGVLTHLWINHHYFTGIPLTP